jgi:hypothetical protein
MSKLRVPTSITLAFDVEKAGAGAEYDVLAIGASVVDDEFNELESVFLPNYFPDETKFEDRCWKEFWSKNNDMLNTLKYEGELSKDEREKEITIGFHVFRTKWEVYAKDRGIKFYFVADTNVFDAETINQLMHKHMPEFLPIPYSASEQDYSDFINVSDYQRGLLILADPEFDNWWGLTDRISELYILPPKTKAHDHNPANDAYTIAFDFQVLMGIKNGSINRIDNSNTSSDSGTNKGPIIAATAATAATAAAVGLVALASAYKK